jgi:hypothetical protein
MMYTNAFLKRLLLVAVVGALSLVNVAYGHGGHGSGGSGAGGSSGGGGSSSGGHSSSTSSGGHSSSTSPGGHSSSTSPGGHSATATSASHSTMASKGSRVAADPVSVSGKPNINVRVVRIFQQPQSTGYTTQYREMNNEDWRRKHQRLFLGFIRY